MSAQPIALIVGAGDHLGSAIARRFPKKASTSSPHDVEEIFHNWSKTSPQWALASRPFTPMSAKKIR